MNKKIIILALLLLSGCNNNPNTSSSTKDSTSNNYSSINSLSSSQHVSTVSTSTTSNVSTSTNSTTNGREKTFEDFEDALNLSNPTRIVTSGTYYDKKLDVTLNFSSTMKIVYGDEILVQYSYSYQKLNEMNENTTEMISTYTGVVYAKGNSIGEVVSNEIQWHISSEPTVVMLSFKFEKELFENYIIEGDSFSGNIKTGMENTFFGQKQNVSDVVFKVNISNKNISKLDMQYTSPNGAKVNVTTKYTYNSESVVIPN